MRELNRKEILRYLGYKRNDVPDNQTERLMESVVEELSETMEPRCLFRIFPIKEVTEGQVELGFVRIESRNLARNLKGCHEVAFLAATLGNRVELLLQKYNRIQVSRAVMLQAAAAEAVEAYCDTCEEMILQQVGNGNYLRPRFSPGYGDFPLEFQKEFFRILEVPKNIGLTLTDSLIMMPSKSVTAVIGISREAIVCHRQGCEICEKADCAYRRG